MRGVTIMKTLLGLRVLLELGSIGLSGFMNQLHTQGGAGGTSTHKTADYLVRFYCIKNLISLDGNNDGDFQKDLCFHS